MSSTSQRDGRRPSMPEFLRITRSQIWTNRQIEVLKSKTAGE
ncbi:MAG: hypothetical protein QXX17_03610 [Conexivisphaerales archaeon]